MTQEKTPGFWREKSAADENHADEKMSLWGGRFTAAPDEALSALSLSTHFDWRLADYDLQGSIAHALALEQAGLLNAEESKLMRKILSEMRDDLCVGKLEPIPQDEDVHTALERILLERAGQLGGKLRAGRSRNDQIATLIRLYLKDSAYDLVHAMLGIIEAILYQARCAKDHIMPGRTHMQHAQPVLVAHHLAAHIWPLVRNISRLRDWRERQNKSAYGAGALAGNTLGLSPELVAQELGFSAVCENSIDATASRDNVTEFLYICAQIAVDISRISEEIIIWNTAEFGYIHLDDSYSTGSSIMPQKKNPDVAELARGKSGRIIGNLTGLLATLKALPLAYDRDLQEDKEPVFDAIDNLLLLAPAVAGMIRTMIFDYERMESLAPSGYSLATDIAEWLVKAGIPFRRAHEICGACVAKAEEQNKELDELTDEEFASIDPLLTPQVRSILSIKASVSARSGTGGTAPERVEEQLTQIESQVELLSEQWKISE